MKPNRLSFLLTSVEMRLVESVIYLEPWLQENIEKAKLADGKYKIDFYEFDLRDFLGALAYDAKCCLVYARREKLKAFHERLAAKMKRVSS